MSEPFARRPLRSLFGGRGGQAAKLEKIGLVTIGDLLRHYPRRYVKLDELTPLNSAAIGVRQTFVGRVVEVGSRTTSRKGLTLVQATITDGSALVTATFFARKPGLVSWFMKELAVGKVFLFGGALRPGYRSGAPPELTHPTYEEVADEAEGTDLQSRPMPIYPIGAKVTNKMMRTAVRTVLDPLTEQECPDPLPDEVRAAQGLGTSLWALRAIHHPRDMGEVAAARHRLRFEEAFLLQVSLARRRAERSGHEAIPRPPRAGGALEAFDAALPFRLTGTQSQVGDQIARDLTEAEPMLRLLQGEVGSGKTVVALRAMLQVVDAGGQAALLAPTEVLAMQHLRTISTLAIRAGAHAPTVRLLTGSLRAAERRQALADAASGEADIVVGTHALLSETVEFADLGLVVVDEQHRFGVEQRDALRGKSQAVPHQLVMTATPIPRSVAMTFFGDVDTSTIAELPQGRLPISTVLVPAQNPRWMERTWQRVAEEVAQGSRVYVVAPRINAADTGSADEVTPADEDAPEPANVEDTFDQLRQHPALKGLGVSFMHGRLTAEEKATAMDDFSSGATPILVSTTVIEVGVDVPEASVMVILDAERFGLSQLHQLRGRVGRGQVAGLCLAVTRARPGTPAFTRLEVLAGTVDGFALAEADLELRREGDVLGTAQSGRASSLRLLRVIQDADLIADAREAARAVVEADPDLTGHPALAEAVAELVDPDHEEFLDRA